MTWLFFAISTAIFESLKDVFGKRGLSKVNEYIVAWALTFFALPLLLPLAFYKGVPSLGEFFSLALFFGGSFNVIAMLIYIKAINLGDLSNTVPLVSLTPLFLLITSPLIVQEYPGLYDAIGIILIVCGTYSLNFRDSQQGYFAPFKTLLQEKGSQLMLVVALIWSVTANIDKVGVQNSSPFFWVAANYSFIATVMTLIMVFKAKNELQHISKNLKFLVPIGLSYGLGAASQMIAIKITLVAHVIAVKRTSTLMSVLWGYFLFKEKRIQERIMGAIIMIVGVIIMTVLG